MDLSAGARLGPYEIVSPLGAGGMGQVYRARDTRLDRTVAIKILPQTLAADGEFRERFDREARVIAQLDHPHICALYDVGQDQQTSYLVMPYLDGETLQQRLRRGPLSLDHALEYATQIASALARAHGADIIHRDLKPANVMLTKSGARLLDFGLAKTATPLSASAPDVSALTTPAQLTAQGTIMGTFQYMSPEQVEGGEADARSDIWAFGCVLYEMLSGTPPFIGKSPASLLANILNSEPPPIDRRRGEVPGALGFLITRCLTKDPDVRWQSMTDVAHQLGWISNAEAPTAATPVRPPWRRALTYAAVAMLAVLATVGVSLLRPSPSATIASPVKLTFLPPEGLTLTPFGSNGVPHFAVSPDGDRMAFVASAVGQPPTLWVQRLDARAAQQIPGSRDASAPFWFPDGQSIGFFGEGRLRTIALSGSRPSVLAAIGDAAGGASNGEVILVGQNSGPIIRMSLSGARVADATTLRPESGGHRWPQFLPDGRRFIYTESRGSVMLATLDSTAATEVMPGRTTTVYDPSGWLLTTGGNSNKLMARAFDSDSPGTVGAEREVLDEVRYAGGAGVPPVSIARNGVLAYWDGTTVMRDHVWFDREGRRISVIPMPADVDNFAIAPDGRELAIARGVAGKDAASIWLTNAAGNTSRFSFTSDGANSPTWSHDGKHLMFVSRNRGVLSLFRRATSGVEEAQRVATIPYSTNDFGFAFADAYVTDWSRDAGTVLLSGSQLTTAWDIFALDIATRRATPLRQTSAYEIHARLSPDNRWFAYSSNENGRWEVFVEPFPPTKTRWQVSTDGGSQPVWRRDGSELLFLAPDSKLMAAGVKLSPTFSASPPSTLFQTPMRPTYPPYPVDYDVTADGQRFLIEGVRPNTGPTISVVVNWSIRQ